jgi:hypothetical protein
MKNAVFWDVTPCGSCKNRRFGGIYRFHRQGEDNPLASNNVRTIVTEAGTAFLRGVFQLRVIANVVPMSSILATLKMEAIQSSEISVLNNSHTS